jgi:DNA-binding IclR family transcriptional regulator
MKELSRLEPMDRDISEALGLHENVAIKYLETLSESGKIKRERSDESTYCHR